MSLRFSALLPLSGGALLSFLLVSCGLPEGLNDVGSSLGEPDSELLDSPGRKLKSGRFRNLLIDGSLDDGGHVVALRTDVEPSELAIIPYIGEGDCSLSPAVDFDRLSSRIDVDLSGVLSVQETSDGNSRGRISFVDFNCNEVFSSLQEATLPRLAFPAAMPRGLLSVTADEELFLVEPGPRQLTSVAKNVRQARSAGTSLWFVENGELVILNNDLKESARAGSGVTSFATTSGTVISAVFQDEEGVHRFNRAEGSTLISETGCSPVAWGMDAVAYFDPCEERQLRVHTTGERLGSEDDFVTIAGPPGVIALERGIAHWGHGSRDTEITLMTGDADTSFGDLLLGTLASDAAPVDGVYRLELTILAEENAAIINGNLFSNWDGTAGDLLEITREGTDFSGTRIIAERVAQLPARAPFSGRGILSDFSGTTGSLRLLTRQDEAIESRTLATGVPIQEQVIEAESGRFAFVGQSEDGVTGTLYLTNEVKNLGDPPESLEEVDTNVHLETARFLEQPRGLAYLVRRPDAEYAELRVYLIEPKLNLPIHPTVVEYRTVPWPAAGILYSVPEGKDQGLWFSKAR